MPPQCLTDTRVLLVEDDVDSAEALIAHLELAGCRVVWVRNGTETIKSFEARNGNGVEPPDVLLLDLTLPDMSGEQLARTLSARWNLPPIVLISAASAAVLESAGSAIGAAALLRKPFESRRLIEAMQSVASQHV